MDSSEPICRVCSNKKKCHHCKRHLADSLFADGGHVCSTRLRKTNHVHERRALDGAVSEHVIPGYQHGDIDVVRPVITDDREHPSTRN